MKPLLEIQSVPISIEYKLSPAKIQKAASRATIELSRSLNGGYRIKSQPIRVSVDTFENRRLPMPAVTSGQTSSGPSPTYHATAQMRSGGRFQLDIGFDDSSAEIANSILPQGLLPDLIEVPQAEFIPRYVPARPADGEIPIPDLTIMYEMDKIAFDLSTGPELEFIPADIEFSVREYPGLIIKYIGKPIYIPASADPEYVPVDTNA